MTKNDGGKIKLSIHQRYKVLVPLFFKQVCILLIEAVQDSHHTRRAHLNDRHHHKYVEHHHSAHRS
ncbi:hypothetical protein BCR42DRAFT_420095 [Absidia repens]|uniref:Uncharacterized protein n=1 Tax=Absidia repens TaxID=90262 RepID=A0A1X2IAZ0_9FUNG|nr:hypothetical protein BCR42DRAFT_420095 [Absidia repens]